jgi:hypothetical protein
MDFGEIMRVVRTRWYVTAPGALLAVLLTVLAYVLVPMKYESHSTIALINSPRPVTAPGNGNPFLTFESSLTATADFLGRSLTSEDSAKELKAMGVTEEYTAALADNAMGPFITLTVTGTDKAHVLASTTTLTDYAKKKLREIQEQSGAPENSIIQAATIIAPQPPEAVVKKKLEVVAAAGGGSLTLVFLAVLLVESVARTRERTERNIRANSETQLVSRIRDTPQSDQTAELFFPRAGLGSAKRSTKPAEKPENGNLTTVYRSSTAPERRRAATDSTVES